MRASVREAFTDFTAKYEGVVHWMYQDVLGLVTTAIGNLIDPVQYALPLPWLRMDGSPATREEIEDEWARVKHDPLALRLGHRYTATITNLRLTDQAISDLVMQKLDQNETHLRARFLEWDTWPADAQLAVHSMAWAMGPAFRFPMFVALMKARDFGMAAGECRINEEGNRGVIPRNNANVALLRNAALVVELGRDPEVLVWPEVLDETSAISQRYPNAADQPTTIVHVDPSVYLQNDPNDDEGGNS